MALLHVDHGIAVAVLGVRLELVWTEIIIHYRIVIISSLSEATGLTFLCAFVDEVPVAAAAERNLLLPAFLVPALFGLRTVMTYESI